MSLSGLKTHGITRETVKNFIIDAGAVYYFSDEDYNTPENWKIMGATRGGNSFTIEQEIRAMEVDGAMGKVKGMDRIINVIPTIVANFIEMSPDQFLRALPGASAVDFPNEDSTHRKITRALEIALSDYIDNIALVGRVNGSTQPFIGIIKNGLAEGNMEITTTHKDESVLAITFQGRFDPDALEEEPWEILYPKQGIDY